MTDINQNNTIPEKPRNKPKYTLNFIQWQEKLACRINQIIKNDKSIEEFKTETLSNFNLDADFVVEGNKYEEHNEIENDFIYAITNIMVYIIQNIPQHSTETIIALGRLYKYITGNNIADIEWDKVKHVPRDFIKSCKEKELSEEFDTFLMGRHVLKRKQNNKDIKQLHEYILNSNLFRKLFERNLEKVENLKKTEYLRSIVNESLKYLTEIESVTENEWINFLIEGANKEIEKLEKTLARKSTIKHEKRKEEKEKKLENTRIYLEEVSSIKKNKSEENTSLETEAKCEENRSKIQELELLRDYISIDIYEDKIFTDIALATSRLGINKSENDNENGVPKNFINTKEFTCFSGSWTIASLLLKSGFKKEDIYMLDVSQTEKDLLCKHAAILVRKKSGHYVKMEFGGLGYSKVKSNLSKEVDNVISNLNKGIAQGDFHTMGNNGKVKKFFDYIYGLGQSGGIVKLNEGISYMYLLNLAGTYLDKKEFEKAIEILNLAKIINPHSHNIYESLGIAYHNLNNEEEAIKNFEKSCKFLNYTTLPFFFLGEIYLKKGDTKRALSAFKTFKHNCKQTRGINNNYLVKTEKYIKEMKDEKDKKSDKEKMDDFIENEILSFHGYEELGNKYITFSKTNRIYVLKKLSKIVSTEVEEEVGENKVNNSKGEITVTTKRFETLLIVSLLLRKENEENTGIVKNLSLNIDF